MLFAATRRRLGVLPGRRGAQSSAAELVEVATQPLLSWLASRGADTGGVTVTNSGDAGWGLAAARASAAGDVLVTLPPSCTLSYSSDSLAPPLRRLVEHAVPSDLWAARLGLVLLSERVRGPARCACCCASSTTRASL